MKKVKKNFMLTLCAGALSLLCATGVGMVQANAAVTEDNDGNVSVSSLTMVQSAAAFIGDASDATNTGGIRFDATLSVEDYQALTNTANYYDVKFGMLVTPTDCIATSVETDLVVGSATLPAYDSTKTYTSADKFYYDKEITPVFGTKDYPDLYTFRCAITKMIEYNYSRPYTARAYIATQKTEGAEWSYTYSDSFERAIYSVATYAMNDNLTFSEDATKQAAVESYLNGIIDKVQQYYNVSVNVTGATGTDGAVNFNDTLTVNGVATKADDTSKTLDMCPTITVAENTALTAVEDTQGRQYTVTGLGNAAYTWTSGADGATNTESGEATINGKTKLEILTDEASLSNLVIKGGDNSLIEIVPVDEGHEGYTSYVKWSDGSYNYEKTDTVFAWAPKDGAALPRNSDASKMGFTFTSDIIKYMKKDIYVYMDIVIPRDVDAADGSQGANGAPMVSYNGNSDISTYLDGKLGSDYWQYYSLDGLDLGTGDLSWLRANTNRWLRLGFPLRADWNSADWTLITHYPNYAFDGIIYISNMFLSSENLEVDNSIGAMNYTKEIIPYKSTEYSAFDNMLIGSSSDATKTAMTDTVDVVEPYDGREGVIEWVGAATTSHVGNQRIYFSDTLVNAWKTYTYLTFDIYVSGTAGRTLVVNLRGTFNGTSTEGSGTKVTSNTTSATGGSMIRVFQKQTDGTYTQPTITSTTGLSAGAWYTIEIWAKNPTVMTTGSWGQYLSCGSSITAYIDNIYISNYSWIDAANAAAQVV